MLELFDRFLGILLLISGLILLIQSLRQKNIEISARVRKESGSFLLSQQLIAYVYNLLQPLVSICSQKQILPNQITWLGSMIGMSSGLAVAVGFWTGGALLLIVSGIGDMLDGAVARQTNRMSKKGEMLDSLLDRYVEFAFMLGMWWQVRESTCASSAILLLIFGSLLVTYSTAKAEVLQVKIPRGFMKRGERMVCFILIALLANWLIWLGISLQTWISGSIGFMAILANLSAIIRFRALYKQVS